MRVFVAGATGFLGSHIIARLLAEGHQVVGMARREHDFAAFKGRIEVVLGDITKPMTYRGRMLHCDASINLVGLLRQKRRKGLTYDRVVVEGTRNWIRECEGAGVKRALFMSAIGADTHGTPYQRTKFAAEQLLRNSELEWTILRPSFVVGDEGAMAQFARLLRLRIVPVWGKQDYFFEPVDVDDVANAVVHALRNPRARRRVYQIGGPDQVTYKEMLKTVAKARGTRAWFVRVPWFVGFTMVALLSWIPGFPATLENLRLLRQGSIASDQLWADDLGILPTRFRQAIETHLGRKG